MDYSGHAGLHAGLLPQAQTGGVHPDFAVKNDGDHHQIPLEIRWLKDQRYAVAIKSKNEASGYVEINAELANHQDG